jgi:diguanylate cyclase (GGDEF)-like protein
LVDGDRQWFKAFRGLSVTETSREISFCTHAIMSTRPLLVEDASLDPLFAQNQLVTDDPHIRSYAGIPLTSPDGYNIGTLCAIDIEPRHFSAQEVAILSNFAKIVMDEIELRQIASTDVLTGIMSRRAWLACADKEMHRFDRYGSALSFLIIDIDHFKSINDRFGHAVGDQIIKMVIQSVATQLRQTDCIGRYGGDEFVIALPETRAADAKSLGKRICTSVEAQRFACLGDGSCTVSIGVTGVGAGETNLGLALQRADQAHYRAKRHGRNQVNVIIQLPRVPKRVSQH